MLGACLHRILATKNIFGVSEQCDGALKNRQRAHNTRALQQPTHYIASQFASSPTVLRCLRRALARRPYSQRARESHVAATRLLYARTPSKVTHEPMRAMHRAINFYIVAGLPQF